VNREMVDSMMFRNSKNFMDENAVEGLDELARVTVLNDNEPQYDVCFLLIKKFFMIFFIRLQQLIHRIFEKHGMLNMSYEGKDISVIFIRLRT
jgi:hypothetical protein